MERPEKRSRDLRRRRSCASTAGAARARGADRRTFFKLACALGLGGTALAGRPTRLSGPRGQGLAEASVRQALAQMAGAHRKGWASAHHGAAVIAAHYFLVDNDLDERAARALRAQVDAYVAHNAAEFADLEIGRERTSVAPVVEELGLHVGELRTGGHDAIYASLALRVLREHPEWTTVPVVEGLVATLRDFVETQRAWHPTAFQEQNPLKPYRDGEDLAAVTLRAMLRPWSVVLDQGCGNVVHWITYADALITLEDLGLEPLAREGFRAHQLYVNRPVWDDGRAEPETVAIDWTGAEYWESERPRAPQGGTWFFGHAFKLPYSLFRLLRRADDPDLEAPCLERAAKLVQAFV